MDNKIKDFLIKNNVRFITADDDEKIAKIIKTSLEKEKLDIPGTAYFDPELNHLSRYYNINSYRRAYFIIMDDNNEILGGVGIAEFFGFKDCAEIQKLYLTSKSKGRGLGKHLMKVAEDYAKLVGYKRLYLETYSSLVPAIKLYELLGFKQIEKPEVILHSTMDYFFLKEI
ncbi:acetyltransferase, GNAT family [Gemella bergeri ATCC 700627]|uniref:Acetyltransferase, GNAT family n=1 Tax=Gemella bergeri ATCC 700627 TaxID=1321820 RepID=U2QM83_9BACL|nr:GNAT family N-acetyltransferase [Gemella bergeri]ERK57621.1 acetyltransferase, GNAT family [Gemella bergeri ATCC 700627]